MYEDLARSQQASPLEWIVVNALIPSVVVTFLMHPGMPATRHSPPTLPWDPVMVLLPSPSVGATGACFGHPWFAPVGQAGPEVLTGPIPAYPDLLRQAGIQGHVVPRFCRAGATGAPCHALPARPHPRKGCAHASPCTLRIHPSERHGACPMIQQPRPIWLSSFCNVRSTSGRNSGGYLLESHLSPGRERRCSTT